MVCAISNNSATSLNSLCSATKSVKNSAFEFYSPKITPEEGMHLSINSLKDFKNACTKQFDSVSMERDLVMDPDFNYEAEYQKYIESRGCKDEIELQALNKASETGSYYQTKDDLIKSVARELHCASASLSAQGFTPRTAAFSHSQLEEMCSKMSIEDLSSYGTLTKPTGSPFADAINEFQAFISKAVQGNSMDDDTKQIFSEILEGITNSYKEIVKFSNKLDEQNKQFALEDKEKKIGENSEKYREKLISKYQRQDLQLT